ncbi:hypothetical protein GCM10020358_28390 [Amorphoplanes nipponensis]|uniref:Uncharacterized protein n=1 Tax=Actinoplanes nipponensis TaxID=135950 RepID=A0A919JG96_9ACTN|nr:hypothetical protein [Actinoplanes nipponensis]GIE48477.1 hypothetical protein Ani05nite_20110 [Actinoplanes nipponensis]
MVPEVMAAMLFMVLLTLMLAAVVVATAWSALQDADAAGESTGEPAPVPVPAAPESLEGVLARQLLAGEITGPQYRRAVQRLAERDADRHPLALPED